MKKIFIFSSIMLLLLFTGCTTNNGPSKKVEEFMGKYQSMDNDVLAQLDNVVSSDSSMSDEQKKNYKALMEKQYQNMSYKIKNEEVNGDNATVDVEIEVYDYASSVAKSKKYYEEHKEEFADDAKKNSSDEKDNDNDSNLIKDAIETSSKYIDYKIKELQNVSDKVKYTITFNLHKEDNEWVLDDISDVDRKKLHGLYEE